MTTQMRTIADFYSDYLFFEEDFGFWLLTAVVSCFHFFFR